MHILVLGRGKTGSVVAEVARSRRHHVEVLGASENQDGAGLTSARLSHADVVIDFTHARAAIENIRACVSASKNMVVGTTGWHKDVDEVRKLVGERETGFLHAANFSVGVNLFYDLARTAAQALQHEYFGKIFERHHVEKKDAPSGTAMKLQRIIHEESGQELEITSFREGDVVGLHEITLESAGDRIYLCHDAKSRRGFAEGAVLGAEWLAGKKGFFDFKDVWRDV